MKRQSYYKIQGDTVNLVEEITKDTVNVKDFLDSVRLQSGISTGILPKDCFYFQRNTSNNSRKENRFEKTLFVIQKEPRTVKIKYKNCCASSNDAPLETLRICLPFVLLFISTLNSSSIDSIYIACSKVKLKNIDDKLFVLPLPNQYDGGHGKLCTGSIRIRSKGGIQEKVEEMANSFWNSDFNDDLGMNYPDVLYLDNSRNPMQNWAKKSENNPFFGCSDEIEYLQHNCVNFKGMVKNLGYTI